MLLMNGVFPNIWAAFELQTPTFEKQIWKSENIEVYKHIDYFFPLRHTDYSH